jgi:hypothetical protein
VDEKILRGHSRAALGEALLDGFEDFRSLLDAVKAHELRAGKNRSLLSYRIARSCKDASPIAYARFATATGTLEAPGLVFSRARSGDGHD